MFNTHIKSDPLANRHQVNQASSQKNQFVIESVTSGTRVFHSAAVPVTILRLPQVLQKIGIGRSKLYLLLDNSSKYYDPDFPRPVSLGLRSVGWSLVELENWLHKKLDERPKNIFVKGMSISKK